MSCLAAGLAALVLLLAGCASEDRAVMPPSGPLRIAVGDAPQRGPGDAPVTVIEFSDFQCPDCRAAQPLLKELLAAPPGRMRLVHRHLPRSPWPHPDALGAAVAAECARAQGPPPNGYFWQLHDLLFEEPAALTAPDLAQKAARVPGLDPVAFAACVASQPPLDRVAADAAVARAAGVTALPTFAVNGERVIGAAGLRAAVEAAALRAGGGVPAPPAPVIDEPFAEPGCRLPGRVAFERPGPATLELRAGVLAPCPAGQFRVTELGYLAEGSASSLLVAPDDLNDPSWRKVGVGTPPPTVESGTVLRADPWGTTRASKLSFGPVGAAGAASYVAADVALQPVAHELSFYAAAVGSHADFAFALVDAGRTTWRSGECRVNNLGWARCGLVAPAPPGPGTWSVQLGIDLSPGSDQLPGGTAVYLAGVELKPAPGLTSYVGATPRPADALSLDGKALSGRASAGSLRLRPTWPAAGAWVDRPLLRAPGLSLSYLADRAVFQLAAGGQSVASEPQAWPAGSEHLVRWRHQADLTACLAVDGGPERCTAAAPTALPPGALILLGSDGARSADASFRDVRLAGDGTALLPPRPAALPRRVAALGDSITYGYGAPIPWPTRLRTLLGPAWEVQNLGVNADTSEGLARRYRTMIRGRGYGYLALMGGVNSIGRGRTGAAVWADLKSIVDQAVAEGTVVILMTITPWKGVAGWTQAKQDEQEVVNAAIRAACDGAQVRCADVYAAMVDPANPYQMAPAYDAGDHLHPGQAGADLILGLVAPLLP